MLKKFRYFRCTNMLSNSKRVQLSPFYLMFRAELNGFIPRVQKQVAFEKRTSYVFRGLRFKNFQES